jgi:hypothetical protein
MLINRISGQEIDLSDVGDRDLRGPREEAIREEVTSQVLQLLEYREMGHRGSDIDSAFDLSLKWAYQTPPDHKWTDLPTWLTCGSGIYLIVGNEASGKSTLMKYILTNGMTSSSLREWAGTDSLAVAAFFLWRNGTRLEKSEEGLLRSLLHSVLDQQPQLVPSVLPREFAAMYSTASLGDDHQTPGIGVWSVRELRDAFQRLINQTQMPLKLFFLIDGIDEYQRENREESLNGVIKFFVNDIAASTNAKTIMSSRPLDEFKDLGIEPQLTLHDLNHGDIKAYVQHVLGDDEQFQMAQEQDNQQAKAVIEYIVEKSNGVFLWAVLSVKTVIGKAANNKDLNEILEDLKNQLDPGLAELYKRMWWGIPDPIQCRASQALQVLLVGTEITHNKSQGDMESMRLIDLALALGKPQETIQLRISPWQNEEERIQTRCDQLAREFTTTWPGFITTQGSLGKTEGWNLAYRINYCHRSVPEFLRGEFQDDIRHHTDNDGYVFCPYIAHIKSAVHQIKILPVPLPGNQLQHLWAFATKGLLAANLVDKGDSATWNSYRDLLRELDRAMQHHHINLQKGSDGRFLETRLQDPQGVVGVDDGGREARRVANMHWSNFHFDPACSHERNWNDSFLSLAIQFGLQNYVKGELGNSDKIVRSKKGRPLLDYALYPSPIGPSDLVTPEMVRLLLDHGANPNERFGKRTCWEGALLWQYEMFVEGNGRAINAVTGGTIDDVQQVADARVEICKLLIERGADVKASILTSGKRKVFARRALDEAFRARASEGLLISLINLFPETGVVEI